VFFQRPISAVLMILALAAILVPAVRAIRNAIIRA
jgi:TctA family transporter